jgi:phosphopantetheinyl transferase
LPEATNLYLFFLNLNKLPAIHSRKKELEGHQLLIQFLSKVLKHPYSIQRHPNGFSLLYLKNKKVKKYINFSHSQNMAACIFSEKFPVGIDIEKENRDVSKALARIPIPKKLQQKKAILTWVGYEAFQKAHGRTLMQKQTYLKIKAPKLFFFQVNEFVGAFCTENKKVQVTAFFLGFGKMREKLKIKDPTVANKLQVLSCRDLKTISNSTPKLSKVIVKP